MPNYTCPSCRQTFHATDDPHGECIFCGARLTEYSSAQHWRFLDCDPVAIARAQRWLLRVSPFALFGQALFYFGPVFILFGVPSWMIYWAPTIPLVIVAAYLVDALDEGADKAFLAALAVFVPVLNVMVLVGQNTRATQLLQNAGLQVGLLGVSHNEASAAIDPMRCRECGYNLTGNVSGRCSECGADIRRKK